MNRIFFMICVMAAGLGTALAQQSLPGQPGFAGNVSTTNPPPIRMSELNFPGGHPQKLLDFMKVALGERPNVVIHPEATAYDLPPFSLRNVTASQVFGALNMLGEPGRTGVWQMVNNQDGDIWTLMPERRGSIDPATGLPLMANGMTPPAAFARSPSRICRIFNLTLVLDDYTVEDVTTAVKGAWELLTPGDQPAMKYHKDTKLLIVVGEPTELSVVSEVLTSLQQNITYKSRPIGHGPKPEPPPPVKNEEKKQ
jgi:hypothetical protein